MSQITCVCTDPIHQPQGCFNLVENTGDETLECLACIWTCGEKNRERAQRNHPKAIIEIQETTNFIPYREGGQANAEVKFLTGDSVFHWSLQLHDPKMAVLMGNPYWNGITTTTIKSGEAISQAEAEYQGRLALSQYQQVESSRKPPVRIEIDL